MRPLVQCGSTRRNDRNIGQIANFPMREKAWMRCLWADLKGMKTFVCSVFGQKNNPSREDEFAFDKFFNDVSIEYSKYFWILPHKRLATPSAVTLRTAR